MDRLWQEVSFGFFENQDLVSLPADEQEKLHMILQRIEQNKPSNEEDLQLPWDTFTAGLEDVNLHGPDVIPGPLPEGNAASQEGHIPHAGMMPPGLVANNMGQPAFMPVYRFMYVPPPGMPQCVPMYPVAGSVPMPHTVAMAAPHPTAVAMPTHLVNNEVVAQRQEAMQGDNIGMNCGLQHQQQMSHMAQRPSEFSQPEHMVMNMQREEDTFQNHQDKDSDSKRDAQPTKYERRNKKRRPRDYYERISAPQDDVCMASGNIHSTQFERTSPDSDSMENAQLAEENVHRHSKEPSPQPQPCAPVMPEFAQVQQGVQDMSIASQIYTDGSRTNYVEQHPDRNTAQDVRVHEEVSEVNPNVVSCPSAEIQHTAASTSPKPPVVVVEFMQPAGETSSPVTPNVLSQSVSETSSGQQNTDTNAGPISDAPPPPASQTPDTALSANHSAQPQAASSDSTNQEGAPDHVMPSTANETCSPEQVTAPSRPSPDKPKVGSWAGLFRGTKTAETATVIYATDQITGEREKTPIGDQKSEAKDDAPVTVSASEDKAAKQLGEIVLNHRLNHKPISLQPRGLINRGNWCYVNATLQALLACPPFYHLVKALPSFPALSRGPTSTPVIDSIVEFVNAFTAMQIKAPEKKALNAKGTIYQDIQTGPVFEPTYVYKMLTVIQYDAAFKHGRQEDAEEFLGCVLNSLHDEMVAAMKLVRDASSPKPEAAELQPAVPVTANGDYQAEATSEEERDDAWEQVGPKKKSIVTRQTSVTSSPVSSIFQGQIRSIFHTAGAKESATLQPFYTLQLDIQSDKIWTVKDALDNMVCRENVQGYINSKTKQEAEASRRILLEQLPPVLILHIKCFVYDKSGGCQKVVKQIDFGIDLEINKELLSPTSKSKYPPAGRKYKLFAVVNHHGTRAIGGHYTTDFFHPGLNGWVRSDDSNIRTITALQLTKFSPPRVPYLLYYRKVELT